MRAFASLRRYIGGSITRQFVLAVVVVQLALTIALCASLVVRSANNLEHNRQLRAQGLADMLAASSASWVLSEDSVGLNELIRSASAFRGLRYAMVLSPSGQVLASTDRSRVGQRVVDPLSRSLLAGEHKPRVLAVNRGALEVTSPILSRDRLVGWTWVSLSRADLYAAFRAEILKAIAYAVAAAAISAIIVFAVARQLVAGLNQLAQVSRRFSEGDRRQRVQGRRFDELGAVGDGVNAMLEAVSQTEASLKQTQRIAKIGSWRRIVGETTPEWSPEIYEIFGWDPLGPVPAINDVNEMIDSDSRDRLVALLKGDSAPIFTFTMRVRRPDGGERVCWVEGQPERNAEGMVIGLVGVCQDITEREIAAAQLRQAQKMESVGQLTGGLAHDFNNLLAIIIGNLDLISGDLKEGTEGKEFAETALQAALRGSELTQQLLAFSRRQPLDPKVVDLNQLVDATAPLWRRTLGENVIVKLALAGPVWPTKLDRAQMESALLNLVINARDAMADGGVLTVETANVTVGAQDNLPPGDYAVIAVSDTGHGMTPEVLAKVVEPFFTTKGVGKGSGLGLSMVYGFAEQSGGQLRIYSEIDHGTTVRLYLPRSDQEADEVAREPERGPVRGRGERVLVVEDDHDVRRLAVRQLTELGYVVMEADSGVAALEVLSEEPAVDLIFTDIVMPGGITGIEMVAAARRARPGLRALFATGFTSAATANNGRFTGADLLISKPYRAAELATKLREALAA